MKFYLKNLDEVDIPLVCSWLSLPENVKIFGNPGEWEKELKEHIGKNSWLRHFIFTVNNQPAGFCQFYDCNKAGEGPWKSEPDGSYGIDFLIIKAYRGKGFSIKMVELLLGKLHQLTEVKCVVADPDMKNFASISVLKKIGFEKGAGDLFKLQIDRGNDL